MSLLKKVAAITAAAAIAASLAGCSGDKTGTTAEINVFIAASLANAMNEIAEDYKAEHPDVSIVYNVDSSGTLQTQIEEGAECDIFFSAAEKQMNELDEGGYIQDGSITPLLMNRVVLIKPTGGETAVTGFENITDAKNLALAGEDVPVGSYAREIFKNMGITDSVMAMEINECANVTAVLTSVAEGANEVGIVYSTDAASMKDKVEIIAEAPSDALTTPVIYPVGLVINDKADEAQSSAAKDFKDHLCGSEAQAVFAEYGFAVNND